MSRPISRSLSRPLSRSLSRTPARPAPIAVTLAGVLAVVCPALPAGAQDATARGVGQGVVGLGVVSLVSRADDGRQGDSESNSRYLGMSRTGRFVAFTSAAANLVPGDTNRARDVFVRDRLAGTTVRASVSSAQRQAAEGGIDADLSDDGRFVVFTSSSPDLVPGDTNGVNDVFVRDLWAGTTRRVSVGPGGRQASSDSFFGRISGDGRSVVFDSTADDLVPGDTNRRQDVFVRDLVTSGTSRVSLRSRGGQFGGAAFEAAISADGRYVAFSANLPRSDDYAMYRKDRVTGQLLEVTLDAAGRHVPFSSGRPSISADGRFVTFAATADGVVPGDRNGAEDVFVRDLVAGTTTRVSVGVGGADANGDSLEAAISADGRFVSFASSASNLVGSDSNRRWDVFRADRRTRTTVRLSVGPGGVAANGDSSPMGAIGSTLSADGRHAAFVSLATNLVPGDVGGHPDVFAWDAAAD